MRTVLSALACLPLAAVSLAAQRGQTASDRLQSMPGYAHYAEMAPKLQAGVMQSGQVQALWAEDSKSFEYAVKGRAMHFDIATMKASEVGDAAAGGGRGGRGGRGAGGRAGGGRGGRAGGTAQPERGRQFTTADSPDGKFRATYRDNNLFISDTSGRNSSPITTDGSKDKRIKYGTASWVYGEELSQRTAMWWSPDGTKLAYYRFDENGVGDYYLQLKQTGVYDSLDIEAYPKSGSTNPVVDLFVYDVATKKSTHFDVRDGKPLSNDAVGYYVYHVDWSPDGSELLIHRTNRRQNNLDFAACNPSTAKCRVIVHEESSTGWVENAAPMEWLADGKRFLWESERNGYKNLYLYDVSGKLLATVTKGAFEVERVVEVNEATGTVYYTARDGDNFMKSQLHRVKLDGTGDTRLTDPAFNHATSMSPDHRYFVDVAQTHDAAPVSRLVDAATGKVLADLAKSDLTQFTALGLKKSEMFTYMAADGKTQLYGLIMFPSNFDPSRKWPTLVPVYGGPASGSELPTEAFTAPFPTAEYGFLIVRLTSRSAPGRGKRLLDDVYLKLGQVETDDMAEGIKALWNRPYFDKNRVGIYGTSYGGYTSAMEIVRHPEVFAASSAASPVTDWRHYDTIYTERYMWIPEENKAGYDAGSVMTYAPNLKGRLMLYYGTADNNVHPNNMMQLITALNRAGKSYDVQVGPDQGHSALPQGRMMEFFIENLVMHPGTAAQH